MAAHLQPIRVSEHVYWLPPESRSDRPSLGAVVGNETTLLLDAGNSPAHTRLFLDGLLALGVRAPRYCVLTHWHWDHVFGIPALAMPVFAHRLTAREIAVQSGYEWTEAALDARVDAGQEIAFCRDHIKVEYPDVSMVQIRLPDVIFDGGLTFDLGGVACEVRHVGGDHAADSCLMFVPQDRLLFLGDCLYDAIYAPERHYTGKLHPLLEQVLSYDAEQAILGHGPEPVSAAYLRDLAADARAANTLVERCGGDGALIEQAVKHGELRLADPENADLVGLFQTGLRLTAQARE